MSQRRLLIAALIALAAATPAAQPMFKAAVEVIEIDVSAIRDGRPLQGLTADDFVVTDNGAPQQIESVTLEQLPLTVTLALDLSQSVAGARLGQLVAAGTGLSHALRPGDRATLITFSHRIGLRVPTTGDMNALREGFKGLTAVGSTSLRDAVALAIQLRPVGRSRPLVLVFSDGEDSASWLSEEEALQTARQAGSVVHVVRVRPSSFLDKLVEATGGRTWSAGSDTQLRELFTTALEEMRSRYLLTYSPREATAPGWHALSVKLRTQRGQIHARPGYFVPAPSPQ